MACVDCGAVQMMSQPEPQIQTQDQGANRWYTRVSVEVVLNGQIRQVKWFSDLQLAYYWCMEQPAGHPEVPWTRPFSDFSTFADQMDTLWAIRDRLRSTSCCALYSHLLSDQGDSLLEYIVTYEPDARR